MEIVVEAGEKWGADVGALAGNQAEVRDDCRN